MRMFDCIARLTALQSVNISGLRLGTQRVAQLVSMLCPGTMQNLDLSINALRADSMDTLSQALGHLTRLLKLEMSGHPLSNSRIRSLSPTIRQLKFLRPLY